MSQTRPDYARDRLRRICYREIGKREMRIDRFHELLFTINIPSTLPYVHRLRPAYDWLSGVAEIIILSSCTWYSPFIKQYVLLRFNFEHQRPTRVIKFGTSIIPDVIIIICIIGTYRLLWSGRITWLRANVSSTVLENRNIII